MMCVSDYVMQFLEEKGVKHIFMLSGGGIMYLVDSVGRSNIEYVCCHHEQAAGIAAQAYAMEKNSLGVCLVTTGPGGTNALTACGAAFMDSTPVLFLSGQVKTSDFASLRHVRQFGAQENDIISMAKPVTKYATTVTDSKNIRYEIEKAVFLATHGRQGPVWLDIPLDVQNAQIEPSELKSFNSSEIQEADVISEMNCNKSTVISSINSFISDLKNYKRPLIIAGHGVSASSSQRIVSDLVHSYGIPLVSTWRALDVLADDDRFFFGSPGLQAPRYSNIITQSADLILVLGSRLDNMITAFNEGHFGYKAKKYIIDLDVNEMAKLNMPDSVKINCNVKFFVETLLRMLQSEKIPSYSNWIDFCHDLKNRYPLLKEKQDVQTDLVDLYNLADVVSTYSKNDDVIVVSSTSRCNTAGHMAFKHKLGQKSVSSMGYGSMGFALPSVVGAWFASEKKRIIMFEGDGSLQLNIQELQTIVHHNIDAKMFIFHNCGYAAIATMQNRNFDGFHVGCDEESGVTLPSTQKIADAYGIPFFKIHKNIEVSEVVPEVMRVKGPVICEFDGSITFDEIPKCISSVNAEGKRVSAALENPYPFLSEKEMSDILTRLNEVK
jgi:acetolactate synthase-1/2/3 large subunit